MKKHRYCWWKICPDREGCGHLNMNKCFKAKDVNARTRLTRIGK